MLRWSKTYLLSWQNGVCACGDAVTPLPADAARKLRRSWVLLTSSGKRQADTEGRRLPALAGLLCQHTGYLAAAVSVPDAQS